MAERKCKACDQWHDLNEPWPMACYPVVTKARSSLPVPMVISDTMDATEHPCTGKFITSKTEFRKITRDHGCVEVGNDPARLRIKPKPKADRQKIRQSLEKAMAQVKSGQPVATRA